MIATATCNDESVTRNLSAKSGYRGSDLIDFGEYDDAGETSFVAGRDNWMEQKEPHWGGRGWYIDMGFFDEHDVKSVPVTGMRMRLRVRRIMYDILWSGDQH